MSYEMTTRVRSSISQELANFCIASNKYICSGVFVPCFPQWCEPTNNGSYAPKIFNSKFISLDSGAENEFSKSIKARSVTKNVNKSGIFFMAWMSKKTKCKRTLQGSDLILCLIHCQSSLNKYWGWGDWRVTANNTCITYCSSESK